MTTTDWKSELLLEFRKELEHYGCEVSELRKVEGGFEVSATEKGSSRTQTWIGKGATPKDAYRALVNLVHLAKKLDLDDNDDLAQLRKH